VRKKKTKKKKKKKRERKSEIRGDSMNEERRERDRYTTPARARARAAARKARARARGGGAHEEQEEGAVVRRVLDGISVARELAQTLELPQRHEAAHVFDRIRMEVDHGALLELGDVRRHLRGCGFTP